MSRASTVSSATKPGKKSTEALAASGGGGRRTVFHSELRWVVTARFRAFRRHWLVHVLARVFGWGFLVWVVHVVYVLAALWPLRWLGVL